MAGSEVIGMAICIALLVLVAYVVAGSIITTSGVIINAQNDMTQSQQGRMDTSIAMADYRYSADGSLWRINFTVLNNGNQVIKNVNAMNVMVTVGSNSPVYYANGLIPNTTAYSTRTWYYDGTFDKDTSKTTETLNPGQWDPNEYLLGQVWINTNPSTTPTQVQVVLPNGITMTNIQPIAAG